MSTRIAVRFDFALSTSTTRYISLPAPTNRPIHIGEFRFNTTGTTATDSPVRITSQLCSSASSASGSTASAVAVDTRNTDVSLMGVTLRYDDQTTGTVTHELPYEATLNIATDRDTWGAGNVGPLVIPGDKFLQFTVITGGTLTGSPRLRGYIIAEI